MKKLFLLLLLSSIVFAQVDTHRDVFYNIDENLNVDTTYVDYIYSNPESTLNYIKLFESESKYIESRTAPDFHLQNFKIEEETDFVKITMHGSYNSYIEHIGNKYKIGGKGFVDRTCVDFPFEILTKVNQTFHIEVHLPEMLEIAIIPSPMHYDNLVRIDYEPTVNNNILTEDIFFELTRSATVTEYCLERDEINKGLKIGFTTIKKGEGPVILFAVLLGVTAMMIAITRFWK